MALVSCGARPSGVPVLGAENPMRGCYSSPGERWSVHAPPTSPGPQLRTFCLEGGLSCSGSGQRWRKERGGHLDKERREGDVGEPLPGRGCRRAAGSHPRLALRGRSSSSGVCPSNLRQAPFLFLYLIQEMKITAFRTGGPWGAPSRGPGSRECPECPQACLGGDPPILGSAPAGWVILDKPPFPLSVPHPGNEDYSLPHRVPMGSPGCQVGELFG